MTTTKQTAAEVKAERDALKAEVARLKAALARAGGFKFGGDKIAVPVSPAQYAALADRLADRVNDCDYETKDGDRVYEAVHESPLPEFAEVMTRVRTDDEGNQVSRIEFWGLVPA